MTEFHLSAPEGFIALSALNELIAQVRKEHPYRVIGGFDTYTDFNQGWQDALDRLDSLLPTVEDIVSHWMPLTEPPVEE